MEPAAEPAAAAAAAASPWSNLGGDDEDLEDPEWTDAEQLYLQKFVIRWMNRSHDQLHSALSDGFLVWKKAYMDVKHAELMAHASAVKRAAVAVLREKDPGERTAEELASIKGVFREVADLRRIPMEAADHLAQGVRLVEYHHGDHLFEQGDTSKEMYVIVMGTVNLCARQDPAGAKVPPVSPSPATTNGEAGNTVVVTLTSNAMLGEMAAHMGSARTLSAIAHGTVEALVVHQALYDDCLRDIFAEKFDYHSKVELLKEMSIFQCLDRDRIGRAAYNLQHSAFQHNSVMVRRGHPVEWVYIVASGEVELKADIEFVHSERPKATDRSSSRSPPASPQRATDGDRRRSRSMSRSQSPPPGSPVGTGAAGNGAVTALTNGTLASPERGKSHTSARQQGSPQRQSLPPNHHLVSLEISRVSRGTLIGEAVLLDKDPVHNLTAVALDHVVAYRMRLNDFRRLMLRVPGVVSAIQESQQLRRTFDEARLARHMNLLAERTLAEELDAQNRPSFDGQGGAKRSSLLLHKDAGGEGRRRSSTKVIRHLGAEVLSRHMGDGEEYERKEKARQQRRSSVMTLTPVHEGVNADGGHLPAVVAPSPERDRAGARRASAFSVAAGEPGTTSSGSSGRRSSVAVGRNDARRVSQSRAGGMLDAHYAQVIHADDYAAAAAATGGGRPMSASLSQGSSGDRQENEIQSAAVQAAIAAHYRVRPSTAGHSRHDPAQLSPGISSKSNLSLAAATGAATGIRSQSLFAATNETGAPAAESSGGPGAPVATSGTRATLSSVGELSAFVYGHVPSGHGASLQQSNRRSGRHGGELDSNQIYSLTRNAMREAGLLAHQGARGGSHNQQRQKRSSHHQHRTARHSQSSQVL